MGVASKYWTLAELTTKIERDLDLEGEVFIQPSEMTGYINEAIDEAETEVHGLYEDYFLTTSTITLVAGTNDYAMPSSIFAHKIRRITYRNGTRVYPIQRLGDWRKFEKYEWQKAWGGSSTVEYQYFVSNDTPGAPLIKLSPDVGENGPYVTVWFLRQANFLVNNSDIMDIPEAANFVMQHVKVRCYEKEGHPNLAKAMSDLEKERTILQGILATMIPDADNEIEQDMSFYQEFN